MKKQFFKDVLNQTIGEAQRVLGVKAMEYVREDYANALMEVCMNVNDDLNKNEK